MPPLATVSRMVTFGGIVVNEAASYLLCVLCVISPFEFNSKSTIQNSKFKIAVSPHRFPFTTSQTNSSGKTGTIKYGVPETPLRNSAPRLEAPDETTNWLYVC